MNQDFVVSGTDMLRYLVVDGRKWCDIRDDHNNDEIRQADYIAIRLKFSA